MVQQFKETVTIYGFVQRLSWHVEQLTKMHFRNPHKDEQVFESVVHGKVGFEFVGNMGYNEFRTPVIWLENPRVWIHFYEQFLGIEAADGKVSVKMPYGAFECRRMGNARFGFFNKKTELEFYIYADD